jgi:hypothetical protein
LVGCTSQQPDGFLPLRAFKPSSSESADRGRSIIQVSQTGNKLKEKSRDLNRNSSRNKNETMFGSGYENCPEFGVLDGVIFKLDIL